MDASPIFSRRRAGILLHPTSLPGETETGLLGADAYRFVDFLADCGFSIWQTLPLGPTHDDRSPYQCQSVHAGSENLIDLVQLVEAGWLDAAVTTVNTANESHRHRLLAKACQGFMQRAPEPEHAAFRDFVNRQQGWLDDYALYRALRRKYQGRAWFQWPDAVRDRDPQALQAERSQLAAAIQQVQFEQFIFFRQWHHVRDYASQKGVLLFGDLPIFVAHDSADVWAQRGYFTVTPHGELEVVAGVPPDYFSATGQRWGNPLYRWDVLQQDGFHWWIERLRTQLELFDLVRIDHFRGFEASWEIDAREETAVNGHWVPGPGEKLFKTLQAAFDALPLVAEDLGVITPAVTALREQFGLPGMKILQFAFDGSADNPYLPHNHERLSVVYTGTHDNNTTLGWFEALTHQQRERVQRYFGESPESMPWLLIRAAMASVSGTAIIPMQDVLGLDGAHRMNTPGVPEGNWHWRFHWEQLNDATRSRLRDWIGLYGRHTH